MSHKNNIDELRGHLFDAIRGLKDGTINIGTARAISDTALTVIASAKIEIDFARATGEGVDSSFLESDAKQEQLPQGITSITRHKLR